MRRTLSRVLNGPLDGAAAADAGQGYFFRATSVSGGVLAMSIHQGVLTLTCMCRLDKENTITQQIGVRRLHR